MARTCFCIAALVFMACGTMIGLGQSTDKNANAKPTQASEKKHSDDHDHVSALVEPSGRLEDQALRFHKNVQNRDFSRNKSAVNDAIAEMQSTLNEIKMLVGSTPIKIGGGSMSAASSYDDNGGWNQTSANPPTFCANISGLSFSTTAKPKLGAPQSVGLPSATFTVKIYGRMPDSERKASPRGLELDGQAGACPGTTSGSATLNSVKIKPIDEPAGNHAAFYPGDPTDSEDGSAQILRFMDMTPDAPPGTLGCVGPNAPSGQIGNEDRCERMSRIVVTYGSTPATTYEYKCVDGLCQVLIGGSN